MVDKEEVQFYPPKLWGLDYHFNSYNKMYVADILNMPEYPRYTGAFCYNNHPIYKVDVVGIVVKRSENSKCFMYAVDDGTGVILSCCWKEDWYKPTVSSSTLSTLPACLQSKMRDIKDDSEAALQGYSLGDLLHVKGKLKVFREQKEIVASFHKKVDNPMVQVFRMIELPRLYRLYYDKPFYPPRKVRAALQATLPNIPGSSGFSMSSMVEELKVVIFGYLSNSSHLIDLDPNDLMKYSKVKDLLTDDGKPMPIEKAMAFMLQALGSLEEEGHVTRRSDRRMLFEVLLNKSKLERRIQMILSEKAVKPKYAMSGCHYLHVLDELHKTYQYARVKKEAVMFCLQKLEAQSDIIRTTHAHYLPCDF